MEKPDLSHWDFQIDFSPVPVSQLIVGIDPGLRLLGDRRNEGVLRRMEHDFEAARSEFLAAISSSEYDPLVGNPFKFDAKHLASVEMMRWAEQYYVHVNEVDTQDWLAKVKGSFMGERFSRAELARWLNVNGLVSAYPFVRDPPTRLNESGKKSIFEKPLLKRERDTLLIIIAAVCKEAKIPYDRPAKAAGFIQGIAADMGVSIGETTIEGHLKKIHDALATRMK